MTLDDINNSPLIQLTELIGFKTNSNYDYELLIPIDESNSTKYILELHIISDYTKPYGLIDGVNVRPSYNVYYSLYHTHIFRGLKMVETVPQSLCIKQDIDDVSTILYEFRERIRDIRINELI